MPYKPTGRPAGRPRKHIEIEQPERVTANRRHRKEFPQPASRRYLSSHSPTPVADPVDMTIPSLGHRKREKMRKPMLNPLPVKV